MEVLRFLTLHNKRNFARCSFWCHGLCHTAGAPPTCLFSHICVCFTGGDHPDLTPKLWSSETLEYTLPGRNVSIRQSLAYSPERRSGNHATENEVLQRSFTRQKEPTGPIYSPHRGAGRCTRHTPCALQMDSPCSAAP